MAREDYKYLVSSVEGLVRVIEKTIHYKPWYCTGVVSERFQNNPEELDHRMIKGYKCDAHRWDLSRMKADGKARYKYLRLGMRWWLFASSGDRRKMEDRNEVQHVREVPIKLEGYSISLKQGGFERRTKEEIKVASQMWNAYREAKAVGDTAPKPPTPKRHQRKVASVRLQDNAADGLEIEVIKLARKAKRHQVAQWFQQSEFTPYGPIYQQQKEILRKVNKVLAARGMRKLPTAVIPWRRENAPAYVEL